jgi:oxalate decarboxylase
VDTNNNHNKTNNNKSNNNENSRRECSELGSAAVTEVAGVLAMTGIAAAQEQKLVPGVKAGKSTHITDPGPTDKQLDAANPDISVPPRTDAGGLPTFKYPFSFNNRRVYEGEWSREVTVPKLPMSKTLAGVDIRLTAGGIRELHWHTAAEWAIMLYGSERITTTDDEGCSFVRDTHVLLSDLMVHTPKEVLPKHFGIPEPSLATLRNKELFIFQGPVPPALAEDQRVAAENLPPSPCHFSFRISDQASTKKTKGGEVLIVDSSAFKVSTTIAAAVLSTGERASHYGFRGGRHGLRAANAGRLYREHWDGRSAVAGDVQSEPLWRSVALRMVVAHPGGTGNGAPHYR